MPWTLNLYKHVNIWFPWLFNICNSTNLKIPSVIWNRKKVHACLNAQCRLGGHFTLISGYELCFFIEEPTVTMKCKTAMKALYLSINLCLSVMDNLSCIYICYYFKAKEQRMYINNVFPLIYSSNVNQTINYNPSTIKYYVKGVCVHTRSFTVLQGPIPVKVYKQTLNMNYMYQLLGNI